MPEGTFFYGAVHILIAAFYKSCELTLTAFCVQASTSISCVRTETDKDFRNINLISRALLRPVEKDKTP